ncbi:MAG: 4Fe-4S dicluster domain-containing protein [Patescibacteria group bacterium]
MKISLTAKPGTSSLVKTGNWREWHYPEIDHEKCISCGLCESACPEGICFKTDEKNSVGKFFYEKDLDYCKGCGLCAEICPAKAITMREEEK